MNIEIDGYKFDAVFEEINSPKTCEVFRKVIPFAAQVVHVRWSGEGMWIPLGEMDFAVKLEDATSYPTPGQVLLYPKGKSETEILIAYGCVHFASKPVALQEIILQQLLLILKSSRKLVCLLCGKEVKALYLVFE